MANRAPYDAKVGSVLKSKWTLERLIGVGGMAAVYAARHRVGTTAAIKILHPEVARSTELRLRFEREAMAMGKLEHPGCVKVLDIDVTKDGSPFLVMELLEGESLKERCARDGHLPMPELLRVTDEALDVLAAAHGEGIIHRDIKPDNLFLTADGTVKVLDFGIARMREGAAMTMIGERLGTLPYMPPEQVKGSNIDARADLFALGAVMFRIIAGRRVHDVKTESEMVVAMSSEPAPALSSVCGTVPEGVARVVDRALAFSAADRYPDARTMQGDVQALRRGEEPAFAAVDSLPMSATRVPAGAMAGMPVGGTAPMSGPPTRVPATAAATPFDGPTSGGAIVGGDASPMSATAAAQMPPSSAAGPPASGSPKTAFLPAAHPAAVSEATKVSSSPLDATKVSSGPGGVPRRGPGYTVLTDDPPPVAADEVTATPAGQAYAGPVPGAAMSVAAPSEAKRDDKPLVIMVAAGVVVFLLLFGGLAIALSGSGDETGAGEDITKGLGEGDVTDGIG
ncbi:MAG: protein kinase, partial [Polyangiaceae bacterium]